MRWFDRARGRGLLLGGAIAAVLTTTACGPTPPPLEPERRPSPVGAETYERILLEQAEVALSADELVRAAERDGEWIEARLASLAEQIEPGTPWRDVFRRLRDDHPSDTAGVLALYREEAERARSFVDERGLMTIPDGPFEVVSASGLPVPERYPLTAYLGYRLAVATRAPRGGSRFADHCAVCAPPLAVHETFPGHHAAFLRQRAAAAHLEGEDPSVAELVGRHFKNRFFHEGWGQYAEVMMLEAGYFDDSPERALGAWRNLLLRVVRARIDPQLHTGRLSPEEAEETLARELLLTRDLARDEVDRHLADPTLKASYYVGLVQVLCLRRALQTERPEIGLRELHDRLSERPLPIPTAARLRFGIEAGGWPEGGLAEVMPPSLAEPAATPSSTLPLP